MTEDKNKQKPEQLQDEQLDEANGGTSKGSVPQSAEFPQIKYY